jgi:predicted RNA-binding Zn-ribbon protein involved in translation (DUF1610 family)
MIIIFGTNSREVEVGSGTFVCPYCGVERSYVRKRVGTYFTLFFIPLFRIKDHGELVECQTCHRVYEPGVLSYRPTPPAEPTEIERLTTSVRHDLEAGMPLQMATQKLINEGIHGDSASHAVMVAAGEGVKTCPACGLSYVSTIARCTSCGTELPSP